MANPSPDDVLSAGREVIHADFLDSLALLLPSTGEIYDLSGVARTIWENLREPKRYGQLMTLVLAEYEVDRSRGEDEIARFVNDLSDKGLIDIRPAADISPAPGR